MIDSHCHLFFDSIKKNLEDIIYRSIKNNITSILSINTDIDDFVSHYNLIKNYKSIFISCGQHPENIKSDNLLSSETITKFCNTYSKVIGIGETGIDLYYSNNNINLQKKSFENHIEASYETSLPIIIHQRKCENEIMEILYYYHKKKSLPGVQMHCFTGSKILRNFCLDNDFYISLSGIVTFKNASNLREVIKSIPLKYIICETDSPFLSPMPFRGKANEPSFIKYTAEFLSNFYNVSFDDFNTITTDNFYNLFNKAEKYNKILNEN